MGQSATPHSSAPDLRVSLGPLHLANPVLTASGTFGYGLEFSDFLDLSRLGGIVVKGISLKPRPGNPPPRLAETPCGMLNAIGLENVGVERFLRDKLPPLRQRGAVIIVNILGNTVEEYAELASVLSGVSGIAALEINISCPNVKRGGMAFGTDPHMAAQVVAAVRARTSLPLITKLSPNVTSIAEIARAAHDAGSDILSCINTVSAMAVDPFSRRPKLANIVGGLSGPAIKPIALRCVYETVRAVSCPVIGIGGIQTAMDALEFLVVGASAVQVGTANLVHPRASLHILEGIEKFCRHQGIGAITDYIGTLDTACRFPFADESCSVEPPAREPV
ncbi:dihydroorotate dehydrogenase [Desulfosoma caldarium]|uniref:Dihydroorotate dehydrogenase n=1 Tax=Desulfosoma caldarium TaxID=610254 RepID=A0A3N1UX04_9BACT|nr:dihydroorotate dehydrogenase [Desulfosoma caldarium]ROQ93220.1 dihydroorotate oxidase B catalytic subunit [Desulfosoma caldarium]